MSEKNSLVHSRRQADFKDFIDDLRRLALGGIMSSIAPSQRGYIYGREMRLHEAETWEMPNRRTSLPACPKCREDELWLKRMGDTFEVKCHECGWSTGVVTLATGQDMGDVIAKTVEAAREVNSDSR